MADLPFLSFYSEFDLNELLPIGWEGSVQLTRLDESNLPAFDPAIPFYWPLELDSDVLAFLTKYFGVDELPHRSRGYPDQNIPDSACAILIRRNAEGETEYFNLEYRRNALSQTPAIVEVEDEILLYYSPTNLTAITPSSQPAQPRIPLTPPPAAPESELPF